MGIRGWRYGRSFLVAVAVVAIIGGASTVSATIPSSPSYQLPESQFGSGSLDNSCSGGQYCATTSIGDTVVGETKNSNNTANLGSLTDDQPSLDVVIDSGASDLGTLSTEHAATKRMIVQVRSLLSSGYTLQIVGDPPHYGGHTLDVLDTPTASTPGTEQFGINAVANSSPSVGANPVEKPSGTEMLSTIQSGYNTANRFKYSSGDIVARASGSTNRTDYTISMLINISNATPAGKYSADFSAIVTPIY